MQKDEKIFKKEEADGKGYSGYCDKLAIYFDFDGTLAEFKESATEEEMKKKSYFYDLMPQENVVKAAKDAKQHKGWEIYGLTCSLGKQATRDKNFWREDFIPEISKSRFIVVPDKDRANKYHYIPTKDAQNIKNILVDDHTPNLIEWEKAGGIGIKVMTKDNGKEGKWQGKVIFAEDKECSQQLEEILESLQREELKEVDVDTKEEKEKEGEER